MAERVNCPVKQETIGKSTYLRWVQFCESRCPYAGNEDVCAHIDTEIHFPVNTKHIDADKADEVKEAWAHYNAAFTSAKRRY